MDYFQYTQNFEQAINEDISLGQAALAMGVPEERLKLYCGFVQSHRVSSVEKLYSKTLKFIDHDKKGLIKDYYRQFPCSSFDLNDIGMSFSQFLRNPPHFLTIPNFLPDLALYEWCHFLAYRGPRPKNPNREVGVLEPTQLIIFDYDIPYLVDTILNSPELPSSLPEESTPLFFTRNPETFEIKVFKATLPSLIIFDHLQEHPTSTIDQLIHHPTLTPTIAQTTIEDLKRCHVLFVEKMAPR